jgi:hypothetical protein
MMSKDATTAKGRVFHVAHDCPKLGAGVPVETSDFFERIDRPPTRSSNMEDLDHCPRLYLFRNRLGIKPRGYVRALSIGSMVHGLLRVLCQGGDMETAVDAVARMKVTREDELTESADVMGLLPGGKSLASQVESLREDYHKAVAMGRIFWEAAPFDWEKWEVLTTPEGVPMVEVLMKVKFPGDGLTQEIWSPCDLALVKRGTPEVFLTDFKTTSLSPKIRARISQVSSQMRLYRLALQKTLEEWAKEHPKYEPLKVVGAIHGIIQTPRIKYCPNTKDKGGFNSYIERLKKWYQDQERAGEPPMVLSTIRFPEPVLPEELHSRLRMQQAAAVSSPSIHRFYRAGSGACTTYNRVCPYLEMCASDPALWPGIIRQSFDIGFREDEETEG